jgi:transcriptional regulator GlxA family with amidase domain
MLSDADRTHRDQRVTQAIEFIREHLGTTYSVADIARHVRLSQSRLSHLFLTETSVTPSRMLGRLRYQEAVRLCMETDLTLKEIAWRIGFRTSASFAGRARVNDSYFGQQTPIYNFVGHPAY